MSALQGKQKYQLRASYLELYDERIIDLLAAKRSGQLTVREDVYKETAQVYVEGLTEMELLNGELTAYDPVLALRFTQDERDTLGCQELRASHSEGGERSTRGYLVWLTERSS